MLPRRPTRVAASGMAFGPAYVTAMDATVQPTAKIGIGA